MSVSEVRGAKRHMSLFLVKSQLYDWFVLTVYPKYPLSIWQLCLELSQPPLVLANCPVLFQFNFTQNFPPRGQSIMLICHLVLNCTLLRFTVILTLHVKQKPCEKSPHCNLGSGHIQAFSVRIWSNRILEFKGPHFGQYQVCGTYFRRCL